MPVELTEEDLKLALAGKFVTRVIYLEDPRNALPVRDDPQEQTWFEAAPGQDPLAVADGLGRPVAILRMGGRLPDRRWTRSAVLLRLAAVHGISERTGRRRAAESGRQCERKEQGPSANHGQGNRAGGL